MIDLSEKSKEELFREKKEAELRAAKMKEGEWKRRKDKESKRMIGGTFLKYFKDALLFEADEWDRIVQAVIPTEAFTKTVEAIRKEAEIKQKQKEQAEKDVEKSQKQEARQSKPKDQKPENTPETAKQGNQGQEQRPENDNNRQ